MSNEDVMTVAEYAPAAFTRLGDEFAQPVPSPAFASIKDYSYRRTAAFAA